MNTEKFLNAEWVPALGCTEPASIAHAGMTAASHLGEVPKKIILKVDTRIYKNCYAIGIPYSEHRTGIKWSAALGVFLKDTKAGLECFKEIGLATIKEAQKLIDNDGIKVMVDRTKKDLFIDFTVTGKKGRARCVIENTHTNVTLITKNDKVIYEHGSVKGSSVQEKARKWASVLSFDRIIKLAESLSNEQRKRIITGAAKNLKIAKHGLGLLPKTFYGVKIADASAKAAGLVGAGVYARMWGESFPVMSIAGSGNKGIVLSVPLVVVKDEWKVSQKKIEEALFIAMIVTSKTTYELGTLSAVCGCSNAAGLGLACALVHIKGGKGREMSLAVNNMVGNLTGMICDGAKIGCAMKTMTSVDAAFRSAALAMSGIGIPPEDGIVGKNGAESLKNMASIAKRGMIKTDEEILGIMERKLRA